MFIFPLFSSALFVYENVDVWCMVDEYVELWHQEIQLRNLALLSHNRWEKLANKFNWTRLKQNQSKEAGSNTKSQTGSTELECWNYKGGNTDIWQGTKLCLNTQDRQLGTGGTHTGGWDEEVVRQGVKQPEWSENLGAKIKQEVRMNVTHEYERTWFMLPRSRYSCWLHTAPTPSLEFILLHYCVDDTVITSPAT